MAKKKLGLANRKLKKNSSKFQKSRAGPSNSFEIHLNKRKFEVLGRKQKHERGLPGISRSRATKQVSIWIKITNKYLAQTKLIVIYML